jgi:transcriptional regulator with XRE-family HTH domain
MDQFANNSKNSITACVGAYTEGMADENGYQYLGFGQAVRFHRKRLKLSQAELAERVGVGTSTVSWYERQRKPINDPFMVFELADALQTTPDDLREGRVRVDPKGRPMDDYIDEVLRDELPPGEGGDAVREVLKRLLDKAVKLPPDRLRELADFADFQADRLERRDALRKPRKAVNGDTAGDSSGDTEELKED